MTVDCGSCAERGAACSDCLRAVLVEPPAGEVWFSAGERRALLALAGAGLMPMLPLIERVPVAGGPTRYLLDRGSVADHEQPVDLPLDQPIPFVLTTPAVLADTEPIPFALTEPPATPARRRSTDRSTRRRAA